LQIYDIYWILIAILYKDFNKIINKSAFIYCKFIRIKHL
jgi:hypothetical protein